MKVFNFYAFSFFFLISFLASAQNKNFQISGTIADPSIHKLYFTSGNFQGAANGKAVEITVKGGKFTYKGLFTEPVPVFLSLTEELKPNAGEVLQFILDAGLVEISVKEKLSSAAISGSQAHSDFQKYNIGQAKYNDRFVKLNADAQAEAQNGVAPDLLQIKYAKLFKAAQADLGEFQKTFIIQNPKAYISLLLLSEYGKLTENYIKADSLFSVLDPVLRSGKTAVSIRDYIAKEKKTSIGALSPDFSLSDSSGKKIPLSSLKGKYVLLDFWASWCGPCRQENPNVVQAYRSFKDKGFTVFGVSLDRDRKSWLKAINADGLTWGHVSDLKYWGSEAAILYGINAIPRNFLLDPEGKIIARDLRGPALIEKLNEIFD